VEYELSRCEVVAPPVLHGPEPTSFAFNFIFLVMAYLMSVAVQFLDKVAIFQTSRAITEVSLHRELLLTTYVERGSVGNVFRGRFEEMQTDDIVGKVVDGSTEKLLHHEAQIYETLTCLQGSAIPTIYGLYTDGHLEVLIMQYAGKKFRSFSELSEGQRYVSHVLHQPFLFMLVNCILFDAL
jgi:hypothetical protein